mmetsp:Transcript_21810/g.31749  ORF Transcript_21810/g.31749 Transcript_21810/m.31749 type:complete len:113 (-) Transcript_21810:406-744(-)
MDAASTTCVPLLEVIADYVAQAYVEAVNDFIADIRNNILCSVKLMREMGSNGIAEELTSAHQRINLGYQSGPLKKSQMILYTMHQNTLSIRQYHYPRPLYYIYLWQSRSRID